MQILLVSPEFPITYWGFQYAMPIAGKKAAFPPLGLISVAALLPQEWDIRLIDMNIDPLQDADIQWADAVLVGGMHVQRAGMLDVIERGAANDTPVIIGGPSPTTAPEPYAGADVLFQGELEGRDQELVAAVAEVVRRGRGQDQVVFADPGVAPLMSTVPVPRFDLLQLPAYVTASLQYSRGCPFTCEFCDIIEIFGRVPRVKPTDQVLAELDALREAGWSGPLFFVDDNFIGNRPAVKKMLPKLQQWQEEHDYPYLLITEASMNLAADDAMVEGMVSAGFWAIFLGIETPSVESLKHTGKPQNLRLDLAEAVNKLSKAGMEVQAGFIVGFDTDSDDVFDIQREFVANLPIPMAMVGLLMALPGTQLWRRLEKEGRLRGQGTGDQFMRPNFEPTMDEEKLLTGYRGLMADLYTGDAWYDRCEMQLANVVVPPGMRKPHVRDLMALVRAAWAIGIVSGRRRRFWRLLYRSLRSNARTFAWAVSRAVTGEHMVRYTQEHLLPRLDDSIAEVRAEGARRLSDGQLAKTNVV